MRDKRLTDVKQSIYSLSRCSVFYLPDVCSESGAYREGYMLSFGEQRQKLMNNFEYMILIPTFAS